jgi:Obg family GTPase CgtA-like protein
MRADGTVGEFKLYQGPRGRARTFRVLSEDGGFRVEGEQLELIVSQIDLDDDPSVLRLQRQFRRLGVEAALIAAGAEAGSEVEIAGQLFTFFPDSDGNDAEQG